MSVIGEAALSALFQVLFQKITSFDLLKIVSEKKVHAKIKKWKSMLLEIHDVLDDAEEKQMACRSVKRWLNDLNDLAYDVEDVLDEFATESLRRKLKGERQDCTSKVQKLILSCCTSFNPNVAMLNSEMASKIKEITERLEDLMAQRDKLELRMNVGGISGNAWRRPPTTSLPDECQVYGRDEDKRKILDLLTGEDATYAKVGVLPIVGMGGLGKTTLARHVFNDESLQQTFHPKAWVCVSEDFDIMRITKAILESITERPIDLEELNQVQLKLHKELARKKFLIVLDDVWNEHYGDWNASRPPFMDGASGCRIIVTTRSEVVARNMGTIEFPTLKHISDDDCWSLFRSHAFESGRMGTQQNLEIIRPRVVSKCAGLPLAARTLGGLLRSKPQDKWEDILNSKIWSFDNSDMLPVLRLSYYHLPSHLKRCFAYCAIFPKDYEFMEMELVLLWMAEGLIQQMDDGKHMEDVGSEHFHDLLSRSLFQATSTGSGGSKFVMHDLVNDLAQKVAKGTCFRLEDGLVGGQFVRERVRHSSYIIDYHDGMKKMESFYKVRQLRTFLPLSLSEIYGNYGYLTGDIVFNLLSKLKCLRVLCFKGYKIFELPDSIGDLKQLRYLDLSFTEIRSLPESTNLLCNLQTLLLRFCRKLKKLPSRIEDLINLRHLDIEGVCLEDVLPLGVKELVSLRTLSEFGVGKFCGASLTALKNLKFVRGKLGISGLNNVTNALHGREANLKEKKDLNALSLSWGYGDRGDENFDGELLEGLHPHAELEELRIWNYGGISFPFWVGDPSFLNLVVIRLAGCRYCTSLPKLGLLPSLRELYIEWMQSVRTVGAEFYGEGCSNPFPALQSLCFKQTDTWKDWNPCGFEFPSLQELTIEYCPQLLGKLPSCLSNLRRLCIEECKELVVSLPSLPVVSELEIEGCKKVDFRNMVEFGSPNSVQFTNIEGFTFFLTEGLMEQLNKSKSLIINGNLFAALNIKKQRMTIQVEVLKLIHCEINIFFPHWDRIFNILEELSIAMSPKLISFKDVSFPSKLRVIRITHCDALASLPNAVCLQELEIENCQSLISVESGQLSSSLKRLVIKHCKNLESTELGDKEQGGINLEYLSVWACPSLTSLSSRAQLPSSLERLMVSNCSKLELIAESFNSTSSLQLLDIEFCHMLRYLPRDLHKLTNLQEIRIFKCDNLVSFPPGGLPSTSLRKLIVSDCEKLVALPDNINNITSLQQLDFGMLRFPEEGFPTNLTTLAISKVMNCKPLFEWGLHRLDTLARLAIVGGCPDVVSFPCDDIEMMLPPSLMQLIIEDFPSLKYLSNNGLQKLTSLKQLRLRNCPVISSFPRNGLPISLLQLEISGCPLLKKRCWKDKGQEWFKIAHIPYVKIDGTDAFDPDCWS